MKLFADWTSCSACDLPPRINDDDEVVDGLLSPKKLLVCSRCKSYAYHDSTCQQRHWKSCHKRDCKEIQKALLPLQQLIAWQQMYCEGNNQPQQLKEEHPRARLWYIDTLERNQLLDNETWTRGIELWERKEYLEAVVSFQDYLDPFRRAWDQFHSSTDTTMNLQLDASNYSMCRSIVLAKRLLFCAYCELDGELVDSARQRLVHCISVLITIHSLAESDEAIRNTEDTMNDAWIELMLSMEEVPSQRIAARHVANMAISLGTILSPSADVSSLPPSPSTNVHPPPTPCRWVNALQRPGYMTSSPLVSASYVPYDKQPSWCRMLEEKWESILNEYKSLATNNLQNWLDVGSGQRGSGHDDYRVVAGQSWKEYVLFGSGARGNDNDAPITKQLLREYVPDAVLLAEKGGGEVIFSRLAAGTRIESHCGPTNLRLTAHLGLVIPKNRTDCRIRVGDTWHTWSGGEVLLFDDSFEHEVRNDTEEERVVLLMRLWHPQLSCKETTEVASRREEFLMEAMAKKEENIQKRYQPPS